MPKVINYPRGSFKKSLEMADAIGSLGGACDKESCAHKMGLKLSGAFTARIGATIKYDLITSTKGKLEITELYKSIRHAYTEDERKKYEKTSFLKPPVFNDLYNRFSGMELPIKILDKLLIKEFDVDEKVAQTVGKYFVDGLKYLNLINGENVLLAENATEEEVIEDLEVENAVNPHLPHVIEKDIPQAQILNIQNNNEPKIIEKETNEFMVHIVGPGMDSQIVIKEEEDLLIVDAMLKKVKKKLE